MISHNPFGHHIAPGTAPALLVIDFQNAYTMDDGPLYTPSVVDAAINTIPIIARFRELALPLVFTRVEYQSNGLGGGLFVEKIPALRLLTREQPWSSFFAPIAPLETELVITKQYASAFFGTSLGSHLYSLQCDTIVITGCSTSGCIRATAVDGLQLGFRCFTVKDCVADSDNESHDINLRDISKKYGEVVERRIIFDYLDTIPKHAR
jgi:maleamate amidohydrolase